MTQGGRKLVTLDTLAGRIRRAIGRARCGVAWGPSCKLSLSTARSAADTGSRAMEDWIVANPGVLGGKPCIKGTRISIEFVLELLASGATPEDIRRSYPQLTPEALAAAFAYAARAMKNEVIWDVKIPA